MSSHSYYDPEVRLSLEIPEGWEAGSTPDSPLVLIAPNHQGFQATLSFTISPFHPSTPDRLLELIQDTRQDHIENYQGFSLLREERVIQDRCPGYIETYHWEMDETNTPMFQLYAVIMVGPNALYTLYGTALRRLEEGYEPLFREIVKSIRFIRD